MKPLPSGFRPIKQTGHSLLEVLIAMGVLAFGILALMQVLGQLARSNLDARIRTLASNVAEEQIETQKRFTRLASDPGGGAFAYQDIGNSTTTLTRSGIEFTVEQTVTDYYWDEASGQFTTTAPPGIVFSDFKQVVVLVSWTSSVFFTGGAAGGILGTLGSGTLPFPTVISSRVTATDHLAVLDELAVQELCVPLVSCPSAID